MAAFTSHGYHIPGTGDTKFVPQNVFLCGGPKKCARCKSEVESSMAFARMNGSKSRNQIASV
jgi:hypothetical protein